MGLFQGMQGKAPLGACLLLTLSLSACDSKAPVESVDVVVPEATLDLTADANSDSASALVQANKVDKEKPKKKLNLMLTDDVMAISKSGSVNAIDVAENNLDEHNTLPNMFGAKQEGTTVGGGILRDAENEDYVESIQGAEVSVEFKID
ncbi:hypothetical protein A9Q81_01795 [Gammaproteobacteria bacterium 42_54_T18]|nr:hypothetical protein A9Q81_01795 [Gammaproteobacteria bacterium 42_54_T18]